MNLKFIFAYRWKLCNAGLNNTNEIFLEFLKSFLPPFLYIKAIIMFFHSLGIISIEARHRPTVTTLLEYVSPYLSVMRPSSSLLSKDCAIYGTIVFNKDILVSIISLYLLSSSLAPFAAICHPFDSPFLQKLNQFYIMSTGTYIINNIK